MISVPARKMQLPSRSLNVDSEEMQPEERRRSCRYPVPEVRAYLSWWESPTPVERERAPAPRTEPSVASNASVAAASEMRSFSNKMGRGPGFRLGSPHVAPKEPEEPRREPATPAPREAPPSADALGLRSRQVRLMSISLSGLSVLSDSTPAVGNSAWFRLENTESQEWSEVFIRVIEPTPHGSLVVRLEFRESCPYDLFKTVVLGNPETLRNR
jgi:hypothetical protein